MSPRAATTTTPPDAARPLGTWRSRILGSSEEDPTQLLANPRNWRIHTTAQRKALRGALDTVGWVPQVIVNTVTICQPKLSLPLSRKLSSTRLLPVSTFR